jgi:hypothetical protein
MKAEKPHEFALRIKEAADILHFVHNDKQPETNLTNQVLINLDSKYNTIATILRSRLTTLKFEEMVQALRDEYESKNADNSGSGQLVSEQAHNAQGHHKGPAKKFGGTCHKCGKKGHKQADCRSNSTGGTKPAKKWCSLHKSTKHSDAECNAQHKDG